MMEKMSIQCLIDVVGSHACYIFKCWKVSKYLLSFGSTTALKSFSCSHIHSNLYENFTNIQENRFLQSSQVNSALINMINY